MQFSRRGFLKLGTGATASVAFGGLGISLTPVAAAAQDAKLKWTRQTTSVCCYCAVGCGLLVSTSAEGHPDGPGKAINVEGNPDHPINEGSLCAKGASTFQLASNKDRPQKPLYRAPGATDWKEVEWSWALPPATPPLRRKTRPVRWSTAPRPLPPWVPPLWTMKNAGPFRPCSAPWAWCISSTRRVSDTAPQSRLWQSLSDAVR